MEAVRRTAVELTPQLHPNGMLVAYRSVRGFRVPLAARERQPSKESAMSLVRLLGFRTLPCGCVVGRYLDLSGNREVVYVEEKGGECPDHTHRRNHAIPRSPAGADSVPAMALVAVAKAS
jgi:hypothetical protein